MRKEGKCGKTKGIEEGREVVRRKERRERKSEDKRGRKTGNIRRINGERKQRIKGKGNRDENYTNFAYRRLTEYSCKEGEEGKPTKGRKTREVNVKEKKKKKGK